MKSVELRTTLQTLILYTLIFGCLSKVCLIQKDKDNDSAFKEGGDCRECRTYFYKNTWPKFKKASNNWHLICQYYKDQTRFFTLYDTEYRMPVFSAYKLNIKAKETSCSTDGSPCSEQGRGKKRPQVSASEPKPKKQAKKESPKKSKERASKNPGIGAKGDTGAPSSESKGQIPEIPSASSSISSGNNDKGTVSSLKRPEEKTSEEKEEEKKEERKKLRKQEEDQNDLRAALINDFSRKKRSEDDAVGEHENAGEDTPNKRSPVLKKATLGTFVGDLKHVSIGYTRTKPEKSFNSGKTKSEKSSSSDNAKSETSDSSGKEESNDAKDEKNKQWKNEPQLEMSNDDSRRGKYQNMMKIGTGGDSPLTPQKIKFQPQNANFQNSGWDKGHLNPNRFQVDDDSEATYTLTNAVPQYPGFNSGYWCELELYTLQAMKKYCEGGQPYLITGGTPGLMHDTRLMDIGTKRKEKKIVIPLMLYTAACCDKGKDTFSFAFYGTNEAKSKIDVIKVEDLISIFNKQQDPKMLVILKQFFPGGENNCKSDQGSQAMKEIKEKVEEMQRKRLENLIFNEILLVPESKTNDIGTSAKDSSQASTSEKGATAPGGSQTSTS